MIDPVAAPLCNECGKPLDMMTVGLNGKDYHLQCFEAACKKTLSPVKDALRKVHGPMSANLMPDHLCRNRACINVAHTELVTNRINVLRGDSWSARNARKMACPRGHPYDEANTSIIHRADGTTFRRCRICKREQNARQSILRDLRGRLGVKR